MKLKEINDCMGILEKYKYDERKNMRPDIVQVLISLERERLLRLKQRKSMKDNMSTSNYDLGRY